MQRSRQTGVGQRSWEQARATSSNSPRVSSNRGQLVEQFCRQLAAAVEFDHDVGEVGQTGLDRVVELSAESAPLRLAGLDEALARGDEGVDPFPGVAPACGRW